MLLRGPASTTKEGGATVLLRGSQQVFVSLRIHEKYIDCLEHDMNAPILSTLALHVRAFIVARTKEAPSRARRFALALLEQRDP